MEKQTMWTAAIIAIALAIGAGAYFITKKNDTPVEQAAEKVLRQEGIDIDFSPDDAPAQPQQPPKVINKTK